MMEKDIFLAIATHIVFPNKLPEHAEKTYIENNKELFRLINQILAEFSNIFRFEKVIHLFKQWQKLQGDSLVLDNNILNKAILDLEEGNSLALYLMAQNVCLLITMYSTEAIISYFQASVDNNQLMSNISDIEAELPLESIQSDSLDILKSNHFSELLSDLANNKIQETLSTSKKAGSNPIEIRNIAKTDLISKWLLNILVKNQERKQSKQIPMKIIKKYRDEIILSKGNNEPFRRSGLWMCIKTVLQIQLQNLYDYKTGLLTYKIIMALTLEKVCKLSAQYSNINDDFKLQMIKKLAKRVYKLNKLDKTDQLVVSTSLKCNKTIEQTKNLIQFNQNKFISTLNLTIGIDYTTINFQDCIHHEIKALEPHIYNLKNLKSNQKNKNLKKLNFIEERNLRVVFPNLNLLNEDKQLGIHLYDIENWIFNSKFIQDAFHFEIFQLFNTYINKATVYYSNDKLGYSRMILASLKLICYLDKLAIDEHKNLRDHHTGIDTKLIEYLLLPNSNLLNIAFKSIYSYIKQRNHQSKHESLIDSIPSQDSFPFRYASQNSAIKRLKDEIIQEQLQMIELKKIEVTRAKRIYDRLVVQYTQLECKCHIFSCLKCPLKQQAERMSVKVYEFPLPIDEIQSYSVLFELQIPLEILYLRDALYLFYKEVLQMIELKTILCHETWSKFEPLMKYSLKRPSNLSLGSKTKSALKCHYSAFHPTTRLDNFIVNNGLSINFVDIKENKFIKLDKENYSFINKVCTFEVNAPYDRLEYSVNSTNHSENQIISELANLPRDLNAKELIKFGFMRSGHHLQTKNLLDVLETRTLSFGHSSVVSLISQCLWQIGPIEDNSSEVPDSHIDFTETYYIILLYKIVNKYLDQISNKWNDCLVLYNLINITLRAVSLSKHQSMFDLLKKCRSISTNWEKSLQKIIKQPNEQQKETTYRELLTQISCFTILTFDVEQTDKVLATPEDLLVYLKSMKLIFNSKDEENNNFIRNLLRRVEICSLNLAEQYVKLIDSDKGETLNHFIKSLGNGSDWCLYKPCYPYWFTVLNNGKHIAISITGELLVNYYPIKHLPQTIINHLNFKSYFAAMTSLKASLNSGGSFETNINGICYIFSEINDDLQIKEVYKDKTSFFIQSNLFVDYLPKKLVDDYSHWLSCDSIEFRPKQFNTSNFQNVDYVFNWKTLILSDRFNNKNVLNINSLTFKELFNKFTNRLESKEYVHCLIDDNKLSVNLPRLDLNFTVDTTTKCIYSNDFIDFKVAENQRIDSLIGLDKYLLLQENQKYPIGKILIPHGRLKATMLNNNYKTVTINYTSNKEAYFCYTIDYSLKRLKAVDSHTAWLYLALLHAFTAQILPDPFLDLTGTEMALYLLQSAICWSFKPFTKESIAILKQIADLSPKRSYYPKNLKVLENVEWPSDMPSLCAHEIYQFICEKLLNDSETFLKFTDLNSKSERTIDTTDLLLAKRAYFRAANLYRPTELSTLLKWNKPESIKFTEYVSVTGNDIETNIRILQTETNSPWSLIDHLEIDELMWKEAHKENRINKRISAWLDPTNFNIDQLRKEPFLTQQYFEDHWLELCKLSAEILANSRSEDKIKQKFILSYFAFKGIDLNNLIFLKRINLNDLSQYVKNYILSDGYVFDSNKLNQLLFKNYITLQKYNETIPLQNQTKKERKRYFEQTRINDILLILSKLRLYADQLDYVSELDYFNQNITSFVLKFNLNLNQTIQSLFKSWKQNRFLVSFLQRIQTEFFNLNPVNIKIFEFKRMRVPLTKKSIELEFKCEPNKRYATFYEKAKEIYKKGRSNLKDSVRKLKENNRKKSKIEFPFDFSKCSDRLSQLYYSDLKKSWQYFNDNPIDPIDFGNYLSKELEEYEVEYSKKIELYSVLLSEFTKPDDIVSKCLIKTSLWPCLNPMSYLKDLLDDYSSDTLTLYQTLIGAIAVLLCLKNHVIRCFKLNLKGDLMRNKLQKELLNQPFANWSPERRPEWLVLQLEMDILIRDNQVSVTEAMMNSQDNQNTVIQMNMGEGKTSVIIPLLIASLTKQDKLVRLIILKSLIDINYTALVFKIGNILNKRVYILPFNREIDTNIENLQAFDKLIKYCYENKHVLLTLPEYCLSFKLKTIEMCQNELRLNETNKSLEIQNWLEENSRDILDESDEILATKYQLVYSVGKHSELDGEKLRWQLSRDVLKLAKKNLMLLKEDFKDLIEYKQSDEYPQAFPSIRLFDFEPFERLREKICEDFLNKNDIEIKFHELNQFEIQKITKYILCKEIEKESYTEVEKIFIEDVYMGNIILILRGLLTYDILFSVLKKRWKVEYGINPKNERLLQAVPFRAKDVPSERAQFAHPDIFILLTYLHYYYSGLNEKQLDKIFTLLENNRHGCAIYKEWIKTLPSNLKIDSSIEDFSSINLLDYDQKSKKLYPVLKMHTTAINFWLEEILFPKEAYEFHSKLSASAWDLASLNTNLTTGFSGTNDFRFLLPLEMKYYEIPELIGTTGSVLSSIINQKLDCYLALKKYSNEESLLKLLTDCKIKVLIDVGALMIKLTNEEVITKWLELDKNSLAGIYFRDNKLAVQTKNKTQSFETSIYKQNLSNCLIYLDEFHTRGTDLNIPLNTTAAVTLGKGLTKDRLFQACMRMRMLGNGHYVKFVAAFEVDYLIKENNCKSSQLNVLNWTIQNSIKQINDETIHWANQGLAYYQKECAKVNFTNKLKYFENCIETYSNKLKDLYVNNRVEFLIHELITNKLKFKSKEMNKKSKEIIKKLKELVPNLKKYDQILNDEMEKEIEIQVETEIEIEQEVERPAVKYFTNQLDKEVEEFVKNGIFDYGSTCFKKLITSLNESSVYNLAEIEAWSNYIYTSRDFSKTVDTSNFDDKFLRPPRWIIFNKTNRIFVLLSAFEMNKLYKFINEDNVLLMIMPRSRKEQRRLISFPRFDFTRLLNTLEQIFIFSGSLFFKNYQEQEAFLSFIGYCLNERTVEENMSLINKNGYVPSMNRFENHAFLCKFWNDPCKFIIKLFDVRSYGIVPDSAHHLEIFSNGKKPI